MAAPAMPRIFRQYRDMHRDSGFSEQGKTGHALLPSHQVYAPFPAFEFKPVFEQEHHHGLHVIRKNAEVDVGLFSG